MLAVTTLAVFIFSADTMAFDPTTGALVKNANCSKYYTQISEAQKQLNGLPKAEKGSTQEAEIDKQAASITKKAYDAQIQAQKIGCQPDPRAGKLAGRANPARKTDNYQHEYVPASGSEAGVPMGFDFIGMIGGIFGQLTGGISSIFPAAKNTISGLGSGMGFMDAKQQANSDTNAEKQ